MSIYQRTNFLKDGYGSSQTSSETTPINMLVTTLLPRNAFRRSYLMVFLKSDRIKMEIFFILLVSYYIIVWDINHYFEIISEYLDNFIVNINLRLTRFNRRFTGCN